jgi:hypothetical protein
MDLYNNFIDATSILYTRVCHGGFFYLDLWSVNHLWSGFMLYLIAAALNIRRPLLIIATCLIGYEIFEILLTYIACNIFIPEIIKDQFTDVFIGFSGSCAGLAIVSNYNQMINRYSVVVHKAAIFFISMSFAFLWLVFSHSSVCLEVNYASLLNVVIFFLWLAQAYTTIVVAGRYGLLKTIRPWLIFILSFIVTIFLNYGIIAHSDIAAALKPNAFITWIYSIRIKMMFIPFLPILLSAAHTAFVKLMEKSSEGFSSYHLPERMAVQKLE